MNKIRAVNKLTGIYHFYKTVLKGHNNKVRNKSTKDASAFYLKIAERTKAIKPFIVNPEHDYNQRQLMWDLTHLWGDGEPDTDIRNIDGKIYCIQTKKNIRPINFDDILYILVGLEDTISVNIEDWKQGKAELYVCEIKLWPKVCQKMKQSFNTYNNKVTVSDAKIKVIAHTDDFMPLWQGALDIHGNMEYQLSNENEPHEANKKYIPSAFYEVVEWQRKQISQHTSVTEHFTDNPVFISNPEKANH